MRLELNGAGASLPIESWPIDFRLSSPRLWNKTRELPSPNHWRWNLPRLSYEDSSSFLVKLSLSLSLSGARNCVQTERSNGAIWGTGRSRSHRESFSARADARRPRRVRARTGCMRPGAFNTQSDSQFVLSRNFWPRVYCSKFPPSLSRSFPSKQPIDSQSSKFKVRLVVDT